MITRTSGTTASRVVCHGSRPRHGTNVSRYNRLIDTVRIVADKKIVSSDRGIILEGGSIAGWRTADYLFSEDATNPDTLRIFESKDYLWNRVVVFHSLFLSACERRHSVKSVCIGHYVLPPASVQDEVRNVVGRLIWECEDEQSLAQASHKSFSCQIEDEYSEGEFSRSNSDTESEASPHGHLRNYPLSNMLTGYVSMGNLRKYWGDLCDFHPLSFRCSSCEAHCCLLQKQTRGK